MTMYVYVIAIVLLIGIMALYLYFYIRRVATCWGIDTSKRRNRLIFAFLAAGLLALCVNVFRIQTLIILHLVASAAISELIYILVSLVYKRIKDRNNILHKLFYCGALPVIITMAIFIYGYINIHNVRETCYTIHTEKLAGDEGYRVALISDLHYARILDGEELEIYCKKISDKNPDIVILCGDIFDESTTYENLKEAIGLLSGIKNRYGVFYVYGNHDLGRYSSGRNYTGEQFERELTSCGITILADGVHKINDEFIIAGRKDKGFAGEGRRLDTESLLEGVDREAFILLLDHQPVAFDENIRAGVDLQLSGHTHAGQIFPVGIFNSLFTDCELNYGYKKIDDFQAVTTSGIAGWGYPVRTGGHSEYVVIDICR